jgi:hypothetical protein
MVNFRIQVYHTFFPHHHHLEHSDIVADDDDDDHHSVHFYKNMKMSEKMKKGRDDNEPEIRNGNGLCHTELVVVALPNHRIHRRRQRCCLR